MPDISQQQLEQIIAKAYNDFHEKNKELFTKDIHEYWRLATQYKEEKIREAVYGMKKPYLTK